MGSHPFTSPFFESLTSGPTNIWNHSVSMICIFFENNLLRGKLLKTLNYLKQLCNRINIHKLKLWEVCREIMFVTAPFGATCTTALRPTHFPGYVFFPINVLCIKCKHCNLLFDPKVSRTWCGFACLYRCVQTSSKYHERKTWK